MEQIRHIPREGIEQGGAKMRKPKDTMIKEISEAIEKFENETGVEVCSIKLHRPDTRGLCGPDPLKAIMAQWEIEMK